MIFDQLRQRLLKTGEPPGAMVYVGRAKEFAPYLELVSYDPSGVETRRLEPSELDGLVLPEGRVNWLRVVGVHDPDLVRRVGERFGLHPLHQEDVVNTAQRPKMEDDDDLVFLVLKAMEYDKQARVVRREQVSIAWAMGAMVSFQEHESNVWNAVLERLRRGKGRMRGAGYDYLLCVLMDALVDSALGALAELSADVETMEGRLTAGRRERDLLAAYDLRREVIFLRETLWPMREAVSRLAQEDAGYIAAEYAAYAHDVLDHAAQAEDVAKALADLIASMFEISISLAGHQMNQVMKVLTIIATIFIPITFVAGVYGMNFDNMPELHWEYGYYYVLGAMGVMALGLAIYFWRRKWW